MAVGLINGVSGLTGFSYKKLLVSTCMGTLSGIKKTLAGITR